MEMSLAHWVNTIFMSNVRQTDWRVANFYAIKFSQSCISFCAMCEKHSTFSWSPSHRHFDIVK